jgi:hypothetical protein
MQSLTRILRPLLLFLIAGLLAAPLTGCSDEEGDGGFAVGNSGRLLVQPISVSFPQLELEETATEQITITNVHEDQPLTIHEVQMLARDDQTARDLELQDLPDGEFKLEAGESKVFSVAYTARGESNAAVVEIFSSDPSYTKEDPHEVLIDTQGNLPQLATDPSVVRFPRLPPGQRDEQELTLRNFGSAPLVIYDVFYAGGEDFRIDDPEWDELVLEPYDSSEATEHPERYEAKVTVHYAPREDIGDRGEILIESNDTRGQTTDDGRGLASVDVQANAQTPCIQVDGTIRRFGPVPLGAQVLDVVQVTNCGSQPLEVSGVRITENTDTDEFALRLGSWDVNGDDQIDNPITIQPGASDNFQIEFGPTTEGNASGKAVIASNDPAQPELDLELTGRGTDGECPEAKLAARVRGVSASPRPTISATPLDHIILDGSDSLDPDGRVESYEWTVLERPDGTQVNLGPTDEDFDDSDDSKREFRALTAGTYKIGLDVVDNEGIRSCNQAVATIVATPNRKIHIELTWTNPADPDESDDTGSDVDLHLVKMGPGQWFEAPYDIYFLNAGGDDGIWQPESPSLDIDVTSGAGPENITMDDPANCEWYAVGVHYYQQLFGTAYATVRIYINHNLVFEHLHKPLQRGGQFWDVARIHWNAGEATVQSVDQLMQAAPVGDEPDITGSMSQSGLCTSQGFY